MVKILALNHFFEHDIASLRHYAAGQHEIRSINYRFFRDRFRCLFPEEVLGTNFAAYGRTEYDGARKKWRQHCRAAALELYQLFPYELIILPTDTFPYVRDLIPTAHELGIPVLVVQKETMISSYTLDVHSKTIGEYFPFVSDYMTVCSERQKQFWLNAGAPGEKIEVTGQPRFDFYQDRPQWRSLDELGIDVLPNRKIILFLSYSLGAYIPIEDFNAGRLSWEPLRSQTENVLLDLVNSGEFQLLIKPHPQQSAEDIEYIHENITRIARVPGSAQVIPRSLDTRHLLTNADAIVGFQTTALLEALQLNRAVVYTCWGDAYESCKNVILPYEQHSDELCIAGSPDELRALIRSSVNENADSKKASRSKVFEHYLGPSDGKASERILTIIERIVGNYVPEDAHRAKIMRDSLYRRRNNFLLFELVRLGCQLIIEIPLEVVAWAARRVVASRQAQHWAHRQLRLHIEYGRELVRALADGADRPSELAGRSISSRLSAVRAHFREFFG